MDRILVSAENCLAQKAAIDSLNNLLKTVKADSSRVKIYVELSEICEEKDILNYSDPAARIASANLENKKIDPKSERVFLKCLASALHNTGYYLHLKGNLDDALSSHMKSLNISTEIGDKEGIATALNSIGLIYGERGDIATELEYFGRD